MDNKDLMEGYRLYEQEKRERPQKWKRAVDKLSITFAADERTGGYPDVLRDLTEEERLALLRSLGFRVLERWEFPDADTDEGNVTRWARLSGGIVVNLTGGYVTRSRGVRT